MDNIVNVNLRDMAPTKEYKSYQRFFEYILSRYILFMEYIIIYAKGNIEYDFK